MTELTKQQDDYDDDSQDTIPLSVEDLLEELQAIEASRPDNRSVEEMIRYLEWCKEITAENFPELAKHPKFASVLEDLGGTVPVVKTSGRFAETQYMGLVVTKPNELTLYYNVDAGKIILEEAYSGKILHHPELSLFHEIVGHCHHQLYWRKPLTTGGGVNRETRVAFTRVLMNSNNIYIREGFLYELTAALSIYDDEHSTNLTYDFLKNDLWQTFLEIGGRENLNAIKDKFIILNGGKDLFKTAAKRSINSFYHFISEKRAWQMEVDYYIERKSQERTDNQIYSIEFENNGWLDGPKKFKSAFERMILDFTDNPKDIKHGTYLSPLYDRWKIVEKKRIVQALGQKDSDKLKELIETSTKKRLHRYFNNLYKLPPVTKKPKNYFLDI